LPVSMPPRSLNRLFQKRIACYHESSIRGSNSLQTTAASNEEGRKRRKHLGNCCRWCRVGKFRPRNGTADANSRSHPLQYAGPGLGVACLSDLAGRAALRPRTQPIWRMLIVPLVFFLMGLSRLVTARDSGLEPLVAALLFAGLALSHGPRLLAVDRKNRTVTVRVTRCLWFATSWYSCCNMGAWLRRR
jgi:hypothetical protein